MNYKELKECLCCGNKNLRQVLDLNDQPLANSNLSSLLDYEKIFPLRLNFCSECTHLQLSDAVDPDLLFRNYIYVSGTSKTLREYFKSFVTLSESFVNENNKIVLDISCNDGSLLNCYQDAGYQTYGIDPSENLYELSSARHNIELDYLNFNYANKNSGRFSIIVAQNVMAHNSYPREFLEMCGIMCAPGGRIFIQNSQADMVKNNEFDTIYHEHLSFYSIKSFATLASVAGLILLDVIKTPIHGNSHVFVLTTNHHDNVNKFTDDVERNDEVIDNYADNCIEAANNLRDGLGALREEGYKLIGYGAAAKGNTVLNFAEIDLDYIVDDNMLKQGLYTPGRRIRIDSPSSLALEKEKICIVPLAWNFFNEIRSNCEGLLECESLKFVRYFPKFEVIQL